MTVLGFAGKAGHGKDFVAHITQRVAKERFDLNLGLFAYADPLKATVYGENVELGYDDVYYNKPPNVRHLLQTRGTEQGRMKYGEDVWIRQVYAYLRRFESNFPFMDGIIIPDVRFPNEVEFVEYGGKPMAVVEAEAMQKISQYYLPSAQSYDDVYYASVGEELIHLRNEADGHCFYIVSDRPTLEGEFAKHASETALDALDKHEVFSGLVRNFLDTTEEDLENQMEEILLNIGVPHKM